MIRSSLAGRLYLGYVATVLVSGAVLGLIVTQKIEDDSISTSTRLLRTNATLLSEIARARSLAPDPSFQSEVERMGRDSGLRLTVVRSDGVVIADSEEEPERMDLHDDRPEIQAALRDGEGSNIRYSPTVGKHSIYVARAITHGAVVVGTARAALPLTEVEARIAAVRRTILFGALIALAVGLVLGALLVRQATRPIQSMVEVAEAIANGHYDRVVRTSSRDEVGRLAASFNRMATHLRERLGAISRERNQVLAILSGMLEGVIAVDTEKRIVHMNEAAGHIVGTQSHRALGRELHQVLRISDILEVVEEVMTSRVARSRELRLVNTERDQTVVTHVSPLLDGDGEIAGAVVVMHDVSDLRRLESVRRDFVTNVSHELKTPLTAIRGFVETMVEDPDMDRDTRQRFLVKIHDQVGRLNTLVVDLLTLARVEGDSQNLERVIIDLRDTVADVVRLLKPTADAKGLVLTSEVPTTAVPLCAEQESLQQMVANLLDNAVKYTNKGSVFVQLTKSGETATLSVRDTGPGIERPHLERIFERFYRVDKARSRELGGTGLGLSIVKHVAIAHGGNVTVESRYGEGSTFKVRLPLATDSRSLTRSLEG